MSAITSQPSERGWLEHKNLIRYEYLVKETSLKDLVILLRAQGFHTTKGQLEYKLRNWNFSKNLDKETWQYVERKISKRKQKGKESDVIHCGRRLQKLKVTKETNRHRETNIRARFKTPPPSPTNPQLSICTPPTFQMSFEWPSSLPWLRFRDSSWNITITTTYSKDMTVHQKNQADIALSLMMRLLVSHSEKHSLIALSKLIAGVSNVMPEWYPGEHVRTAQNLLANPTAESTSECFKVMVYMLSNSITTQDDRQLDFFTSLTRIGIIDLKTNLKKLRNESPTIRAFLERLFQFEIEQATSPCGYSIDEPRPLHLITWLLELGQDPNCYCYVVLYRGLVLATPIQQAINAGYLELVELLLRFHARADVPQGRTHEEAFVNLALASGDSDVRKVRMLNLSFDHKFLNMDEMLRAAIELRDEALMCKMLQCGADATSYETSWLHPARRREQDVFFTQTYFANPSALMMAVRTGGRIANLMLDYLLLKGQLAPSIVADAYIAAAYGGHYTIMLRLDTMHTSEMVCNTEGITPLQAAVVGGNSTVRKHLLERYGGASSLLVFVAAFLANTNVLQLLIDYGGNPNNQIVTHDIKLYDYLNIPGCRYGYPIAILTALIPSITRYNCKEQSVLKLIDNGATLSPGDVAALSRLCLHRCLKVALTAGGNPEDEDGIKRTALQCALDGSVSIDEGDLNSNLLFTVGLLIQAGAKLTGGEVVKAIRLREKDAVLLLLRHGGTLTDVDETGRGCLEAEINARNDRSLQEALEMQEFPIDAGPLCAAIHEQDWALVGRLFERVHNPLNCHLLEGTAVGLAAEAGQLDILDRLLVRFTDALVLNSAILPFVFEEGALMPSRGFTIERCRDRSGYWRAPPDEEGEPLHTEGSPLALAALGKYTSGFRELLRCGCSMDRIAWNIIAESERSSDYLQLLKAFGCGLGTSTKHDRELKTALCEAITVRKHDMARYLVEVGSNVNEYDISIEGSVSPLQCAMKEGDIDMAVYLLEQGANVNDPPAFEKGATALQFAAIGGHIGFSGRLLQLGAKVNARGSSRFGRSALEGAAEHGRLDMLALLVHYGAVTTGQGRQQLVTAVAYAQGRAHYTAAEWLKENCGWTDADQTLLERIDADDEEDQEECLMLYCCGEYHVSEGQCVYHYTEEQRNNHYNDCVFCKELRDGRDDGSESNFLSEDKDTDSVGDED